MSLDYYKPYYFEAQELVPPEVYASLGENSLLVMDYRILKTIDAIREFFGCPCWINTWKYQKNGRKHSGFRTSSDTTGAKWSQHKFGRAVDMIVDGIDAEEVRKRIIKADKHFPYITVIEYGVDWLHIDCRAIVGQGIQLILPQ